MRSLSQAFLRNSRLTVICESTEDEAPPPIMLSNCNLCQSTASWDVLPLLLQLTVTLRRFHWTMQYLLTLSMTMERRGFGNDWYRLYFTVILDLRSKSILALLYGRQATPMWLCTAQVDLLILSLFFPEWLTSKLKQYGFYTCTYSNNSWRISCKELYCVVKYCNS